MCKRENKERRGGETSKEGFERVIQRRDHVA